MRRFTWVAPAAIVLAAAAAGLTWGLASADKDDDDDDELALSAKDMNEGRVALEDALKASEAHGTPISAKYEMDKGKLQLSVYTAKGDKFSELIVDHKTGKIAKSEAIMSSDDLKDAQAQSTAMTKAKDSLRSAVEKAVAANKGFRAVS